MALTIPCGTESGKQCTIRRSVTLSGIGLHTGKRSSVMLEPSDPGSGILFFRAGRRGKGIPARLGVGLWRRTQVPIGDDVIETVEHLLSAVVGLGLSNLRVTVDGPEIPGFDGSAASFCEAIRSTGLLVQDKPREVFKLKAPVFVSLGSAALGALPYAGLRLSYTLDYPNPALRDQQVSFDVSPSSYAEEIAPARTFCTVREAREIRRLGLGRGAHFDNTLVMTVNGPMRNRLRFPDECARHKVLDILGDLGRLGFELQAHVIGIRSGHRLNHELVRLLLDTRHRTQAQDKISDKR